MTLWYYKLFSNLLNIYFQVELIEYDSIRKSEEFCEILNLWLYKHPTEKANLFPWLSAFMFSFLFSLVKCVWDKKKLMLWRHYKYTIEFKNIFKEKFPFLRNQSEDKFFTPQLLWFQMLFIRLRLLIIWALSKFNYFAKHIKYNFLHSI